MKIIICNEISLDGSATGFEFNPKLFYETIGKLKYEVHLTGSTTAKSRIDMFVKEIPKETLSDFKEPDKFNKPRFAIIDSTGKLQGLLHVLKNSEYNGNLIIFVSENTPKNYVRYLEERNYDYHVVGRYNVNLKKMLRILEEKYKAKTIIVDSGGILSAEFLDQGLADEIHLVVSPNIVGEKRLSLFRNVKGNYKLDLIKEEKFDKYIYLVYEIAKS